MLAERSTHLVRYRCKRPPRGARSEHDDSRPRRELVGRDKSVALLL